MLSWRRSFTLSSVDADTPPWAFSLKLVDFMRMKRLVLTNFQILALPSAFAFILSGCAPIVSGVMNAKITDDDVKRKTATYFGVKLSQLEISNIKNETLATSYQVRLKGAFYNCAIYYGAVTCKKPGG